LVRLVIAVRLMGGLGNQLFQYAAGRRLSLARGSELVLDLGWFEHESAGYATPRHYALESFDLPGRRVSFSPDTVSAWERGEATRIGGWRSRRIRTTVIRQEPSTAHVDPRVIDAPDDSLLVGYWQSERYFEDVADVVRADLLAPVEPSPDAELADRIRSSESVAVHVRRGDYVLHPQTEAFHGVLPVDYYRAALSLIGGEIARPETFVFSDDPGWVRANLSVEESATVASRVDGDPVRELMLMRLCHHHVVANSSFSWWGAWLCEYPRKIVVAPRDWFRDRAIDTTDLVPSDWRRI
jgi:Glycosyl transferase family 11